MQSTVPAAFQAQLASLWQPYLHLQAALASDDTAEMAVAARQFSSALDAIDASTLDDRGQKVWNLPHSQIAAAVQAMLSTDQIKDVRVQFEPLSDNLTTLVETLGMGDVGAVYQLHCPMAFDNRGAFWLQDNPEVSNPYFGNKMPRCGSLERQIVGNQALERQDNADHQH
jgi:Cu(I)/Ag(I) efflux system membrane fusion protein